MSLSTGQTARVGQVGDQGVADLAQHALLVTVEGVEQVGPDGLDVPGRRLLQLGQAFGRELGERPAPVLGTRPAAHPARRLQACDGMGEPAARRQRRVGELAHPQRPVRCLGEADEDLVVGVREPGVALQLALEAVEQQALGGEEGTPCRLLVVVQPACVGGHGQTLRK